jgi:hypothetical protein
VCVVKEGRKWRKGDCLSCFFMFFLLGVRLYVHVRVRVFGLFSRRAASEKRGERATESEV